MQILFLLRRYLLWLISIRDYLHHVSKRDSLNKGDIVHFIGNTHYTSSYQNGVGKNASPCEAEVTAINNFSSSSVVRRYHLVGDGVYGWVDSLDIEELS